MHVDTDRLQLKALDAAAAHHLVAPERPLSGCATDFPSDKDTGIAGLVLSGVVAVPTDASPWGSFVMVRRDGHEAIGTIGFKGGPDGTGTVEVGYGVCTSNQGKGFATEALVALVRLAYERGADVVVAETDDDNVASQRVLTKAGFTRVATREAFLVWRHAGPTLPGE